MNQTHVKRAPAKVAPLKDAPASESAGVRTRAADLQLLEWLMEQFRPEEELQWQIDVDEVNSGWHDLEHVGQISELVHRLGDGDWLVIQTKLQGIGGRYAQTMSAGETYHVEVAVYREDGVHNFRMGYGEDSARRGNIPSTMPGEDQFLGIDSTIDVLSAWARGGTFLPGYGAALHIY